MVVAEFQRSEMTLQQCLFPRCHMKCRETWYQRNEDLTKNTIEGLSIRMNGAGSDPYRPSGGAQLIPHPAVSIDVPHLV